MNILKDNEMCTLKVWTLYYINFILIDLLKWLNQKKGKEDQRIEDWDAKKVLKIHF